MGDCADTCDLEKAFALLVVRTGTGIPVFDVARFMESLEYYGFLMTEQSVVVGKERGLEMHFSIIAHVTMAYPSLVFEYVASYFKFSDINIQWRPWRAKEEDRLFDALSREKNSYIRCYPVECRLQVGKVRLIV